MTDALLAKASWRRAPATLAVLNAMAVGPGETRFVGGVVRDALIGKSVADIDLATTVLPKETMARIQAAGLKAVPTGLAHGTITAVSAGKPFEITTLRRDFAADGRHAEAVFTDDWTADAARRDFTVNAMSADRDGTVYDYFGGQEDLSDGRIRFIGNAAARVEEDYLRILRFFRFHAWYGNGPLDGDGLAACAAGIAGLSKVSAERVRAELLRLLSAPDPRRTLKAMNESLVLKALVDVDGVDLSSLIGVELMAGRAPDPFLRLAALAPGHMTMATDLRLSNAEAAILRSLAPPWSDLGSTLADWRRSLYRMGRDRFEGRALLAASIGETAYLASRLATASDWKNISLPIKGRDLITLGLPVGPAIGEMMVDLENWWSDQDFAGGREAMLQEAKRRIDI